MSKLTVTEKEHWKRRVERRVEKAMDALSTKHPTFLPELEEKAHQMTIESLGIAEFMAEQSRLEEDIQRYKDRLRAIEMQLQSKVLGKPESEVGRYYASQDVNRVIKKHQAIVEDELLSASSTGEQFLALRREKEELLDTVWLATSSRQIKELWNRVAEIVGDEPTHLQSRILEEQE